MKHYNNILSVLLLQKQFNINISCDFDVDTIGKLKLFILFNSAVENVYNKAKIMGNFYLSKVTFDFLAIRPSYWTSITR